MRVQELWRYPVKSLQGQQLREARITPDGLDGDRRYAIFDVDTGIGLTARRIPQLLFASASLNTDGDLCIILPDGSTADGDYALSDWLGRHVALRSADEDTARRYEDVVDFERETSSAWKAFEGAPGPFHDSTHARVSLASTNTIGTWDSSRFRANVLLEGDGEDTLVGTSICLGEAALDVRGMIQRCVMVTRPQPQGIDRDLDVLRVIANSRARCLAVGATVSRPGAVAIGDELRREWRGLI